MKNAFEYEAELTALREEIERLKAERFEELYNAAIDERDAAEKLNSRLISRMKHFASCADVRQVGTLAMDFVATLQPSESGVGQVAPVSRDYPHGEAFYRNKDAD